MKNRIKVIRISVLAILLLILMGEVSNIIEKYVENMKIRNILVQILLIGFILLFVILVKNPRFSTPRVTILDGLVIVITAIVFIVSIVSLRNDTLSFATEIVGNFQGNNGYTGYYSNGTKGYGNIETALENSIKNRKEKSDFNKLEEVYHIQIGEKIFIYLKEDEKNIVEFAFLKQDDLYYCLGSTCVYVLYDGRYTVEETIRGDIVYTMGRDSNDELAAPAWGVSTDERIFSMTINGENVDDVILINEKDGKKYYFWIITNVEAIKSIDDVKAAEIEMNSLP